MFSGSSRICPEHGAFTVTNLRPVTAHLKNLNGCMSNTVASSGRAGVECIP